MRMKHFGMILLFTACLFSAAALAEGDVLILPASTKSIGAEAFASAESDALLHVWIPETVTDIAPGAFERPGGAVLHGAGGSAAAAYAKKNQLPFRPE